MAYMIAHGPCWCCGRAFSFNPDLVPSFRDPETNVKEPVCDTCMELVNRKRRQRGQLPHPVHPNAYGAEEVP